MRLEDVQAERMPKLSWHEALTPPLPKNVPVHPTGIHGDWLNEPRAVRPHRNTFPFVGGF